MSVACATVEQGDEPGAEKRRSPFGLVHQGRLRRREACRYARYRLRSFPVIRRLVAQRSLHPSCQTGSQPREIAMT